MSVSTNDRRTTINASNGQTSLSGDFILYDESQVVVTRTRASVDTVLALTTDYTVSGTGVAGGFTVTLLSAAQTDDVYVIEGDRPVTSDASFSTGGDFKATEVNGRLDRAAVERQELRRDLDDMLGVLGDLDSGEGLITGSLTAGNIPVAQDDTTLADSVVSQSGSIITVAGIMNVSDVSPIYALYETDATSTERNWWIIAGGGALNVATMADSGLSGNTFLTVSRSGTTASGITVVPPVSVTGNIETTTGVLKARGLTLTDATSGAVLLDSLDQTGIMTNGVPQYDGASVVWALVDTGSIDTTGAVTGDVIYFDGVNAAWGVITGFSGDDGAAANPTYGFVNEANPNGLGMYRSAADTLGFSTDGAERLTIGNSNAEFSVGIGVPYNASGRFGLWDSDSSHKLYIVPGSNLTDNRVLTITTGDAARTLTLSGDLTVASSVSIGAGTSGGVPYYSAAGTLDSSAALGATQVILGGGAGAAPNASSALRFNGTSLSITAAQPNILMYDSTGGVDQKYWTLISGGDALSITTWTDAFTAGAVLMRITRSGVNASAMAFTATTSTFNGVLAVTGNFSTDGNATLGNAAGDSHTINGNITQSADTDRANIFGRVLLDSRSTDQAYFSHYDMSGTANYAVRQNASGYTRINAATGQGIDLRINDTNVAVYNATNLTLSLPVSQSADTDVTNIFGRVRLDSRTTDQAIFSHYDYTATTDFSLKQNANGATIINAVTGQTITFAVNNTAYGSMSSTGVAFGVNNSTRGILTLAYGSGGNTAAYVSLYSRNGTQYFIWVEDDGTFKVSTTVPVNNADGTVVGTQT